VTAWLRRIGLSIDGSYWFLPALLSLGAVMLAAATLWLDSRGAGAWLDRSSWIDAADAEGARNLLNVIAGSMITVAATVFSITIAAVVYASGSYGPRLLNNFMEDRGNQLSLGTFIATFIYAVMVLRAIGGSEQAATVDSPDVVPQLSLLIATVLMALSIGVLVYFLHHVPASIRINSVIQDIGGRLLHDIAQRFPEAEPADCAPADHSGRPVMARQTGYIQIIDFAGLKSAAREYDVRLTLGLRTGDFAHRGVPLVRVRGADGQAPAAIEDALVAAIHDAFAYGALRTPAQDLEFLIDELVEIALRALSPAVNDPFSAVTALHWLSAAMAELGRRNLNQGPEQSEDDRQWVSTLDDDFAHFLARGFGCIRPAAATSPIAAKQFLDGLLAAAGAIADPRRRTILKTEAARLVDQARHDLGGPALDELVADHEAFKAQFDTQHAAP